MGRRIWPEHLGEGAARNLLPALDDEVQEKRETHLGVMRDANGADVDGALAQRSEADERGHDTAVR
jgi:hypothetical protein